MIEQGTVTNVIRKESSASMVATAALAATTVFVNDAFPFNEAGGQLQFDNHATIYTYTSVDMDADSILLSTGLTSGVGDEVRVFPYPRGMQKFAMVQLDDEDEGVLALVPPSWTHKLVDGIRDPVDREEVLIDDSSGRWTVIAADDEDLDAPYMEAWLSADQTIFAGVPGTGLDNVAFDAFDPVNTGVGFAGTTFTILKAGLYVITCQLTMGKYIANTFTGNLYIAPATFTDQIAYECAFLNSASIDNIRGIMLAVTRKLEVGDQITAAIVTNVVVTTGGPGAYALPEKIKAGRGKTRLSIAWVAA